MQPEDLITLTAARGVDATKAFEVPGTGPVRWTIAEAGMACGGVPQRAFRAILYTFAGDDDSFWFLHRGLTHYARALAAKGGWPDDLNPRIMAGLVLMEERRPAWFRDSVHGLDIRRVLLVARRESWRKFGQRGYEGIYAEYREWVHTGVNGMVRWLRGRAA